MTLADIAVKVVAEAPHTANLRPVLHEIRHALQALAADGATTLIDLHGLPFAPQELEALEVFLGVGEVDLTLPVLGKTRIRESVYAGVWRVEHFDEAGRRIGYCIEVTQIPGILCSQPGDISEALATMNLTLTGGNDNGSR